MSLIREGKVLTFGGLFMVKNSKGKKWSLKRKIITAVLLTPLAIVLIVLLIFSPAIVYYGRMLYVTSEIDGHQIDTTLTMDQKLEDFDYMYEIVCLSNPNKERIEKACGISYDDIRDRYRELILNSKTDYEYFSLMACFLGVLPGQHNVMQVPDYYNNTQSFLLSEIYASQEMRDYAYSWKEEFRDDVQEYRQHSLYMFHYIDGKYIGIKGNSRLFSFANEYALGQIVTIDGRDPNDMCFEFLLRESVNYDQGNDIYFRPNLYFNDGIGEPHTVEILMPDGNTVTTTLYEAAGFEIALTDAPSTYPEMFASSSSESASAGSDTAVSDAPKTYTIYKDPEGKFVYVNSTSCTSDEGDRLAEDMTLALNETGAETVIFDVRSNGGGVTGFCNRQVLPALFSHDLEYPTDSYGIKNDFTRCFYNDLYYRIYFERPIKVEGDNYFVHEDFNVEGKAAKNYKIYLLTSYSTFSSADLMTCLCKAYDNATVVGTNTGGEGICGTPFHCYLPNSHFMFNYTSTANVNVPENNFMGTSPDIYIPYTVEEFCKRSELLNQGLDVNSFEVRMMYDKTLNYVVDLAANG